MHDRGVFSSSMVFLVANDEGGLHERHSSLEPFFSTGSGR